MDNETQEARVYRPSTNDLSSPLGQIARYVAATGQILNIGDVTSWLKKDVAETEKEPTKSILCMPIANGQRTVIGVAQLINKVFVRIKQSYESTYSFDRLNIFFSFFSWTGQWYILHWFRRLHLRSVCHILWPWHTQHANVRVSLQTYGKAKGRFGMP